MDRGDNKLGGLMIKADPKKGQAGKYKLLFEGKDDDGDGKVNEDPVGGINVNMNGTNEYKPYETYGGVHPFAAKELIALADFLFERPNILSVFTFNYHNNFDKGWKIKYKGRRSKGNMFSTDSAAYNALASDLKPLAKYPGEKLNNGSIAGWAFYDAGRFSFSAPAWTYPEVKDSTEEKNKKNKKKTDDNRETLAYKWIVKNTPGNYLEWKEIKHPDFPNQKVEVGGFVPFAKNNPPEDSLTIISKNANKLLFRLYKSLPLLKVPEPLVEDLGNDVFRVTLTIKNEGTLPTHTEVGRGVKALQPVLIKTKPAKSQTIASGNEITFIQDPITGGSAVTKTFVIVGKGRVVFNVGSPSAGYNELNVQL
ncbi:MAG: hypothetical protein K9J16_17700 [Melioribacteraceae bacterium]|nr:hypothetical protein [Melioribacteraceae bacterium]MCF8353569.1 hypothetical protein [Melioribacteraceae bacterium]MCF8393492.1 hypothetical protein [Melioribacteraceae bacterium]MCF8419302.1 hypothetical protein [Melioribacteraceae bacterium]